MKTLFPIKIAMLSGFVLTAAMCSTPKATRPTISVSIAPLQYITEQITDSDFRFNVLVPSGASPETYEPTPSQMREVANSQLYIHTGLIDFENNLQRAVRENMPEVQQVSVSEGIDLIEGSCGHETDADHSKEADHHGHDHGEEALPHGHHHGHGVDPHIWNSPKALKQIAATIYRTLALRYPDSVRYEKNYTKLVARLDSLDSRLTTLFQGKEVRFMIYHPALTYLARDYGLHQIALENEGKEPSAEYVRQIIDTARRWQIDKLFYQRQFSKSTVDALAKELNIKSVAIDPLAPDVIAGTLQISELIANP